MRTQIRFFQALVLAAIVGIAVWQVMVYRDCRADGLKSYQCMGMLSGERYVLIEDHIGGK